MGVVTLHQSRCLGLLGCLLPVLAGWQTPESSQNGTSLSHSKLSSVPTALSLCHHRGNGIKVVTFRAEVLTTGSDGDAI